MAVTRGFAGSKIWDLLTTVKFRGGSVKRLSEFYKISLQVLRCDTFCRKAVQLARTLGPRSNKENTAAKY